jgi:hypothetical protein
LYEEPAQRRKRRAPRPSKRRIRLAVSAAHRIPEAALTDEIVAFRRPVPLLACGVQCIGAAAALVAPATSMSAARPDSPKGR